MLLDDDNPVDATAENLDSLGKASRMGKSDKRFLLPKILDILQRDRLALSTLLCELIERLYVRSLWARKTDN